ncbi:MAG: hypothetical protein UT63_C0071G0004 [Candidatus Gottesmanbacteria bacterium GW2011_GWC2_39_8]|uniref:Uncharacterized protein n=1 Tax=Candidatus Gottesmanbacteria bacterium GW2011_GWC2_39_8 TaxID=1618450 RepID=A0A0G0PT96_9BACT|nr:MAG: hypothetical protein UT63_C0071G0004 [Candidatus Gottesmanbacteria bacterium GW2011_GWC2_39_8]
MAFCEIRSQNCRTVKPESFSTSTPCGWCLGRRDEPGKRMRTLLTLRLQAASVNVHHLELVDAGDHQTLVRDKERSWIVANISEGRLNISKRVQVKSFT